MFKNNKYSKTNKNSNKDISHIKSKMPWNKVIVSVFFILCIFLMSFSIMIHKYLGKINKIAIYKNDLNIKDDILEKEDNIIENNDIKNIALFGLDEIEGTVGRSDCSSISFPF